MDTFGVTGAQLFGSADERAAFEVAMDRAMVFANRLNIPTLVFGSPGSRTYPDTMTRYEAWESAAELFVRLGLRAQALGVTVAVEPNPPQYNTNFLTSVDEAARFVAMLNQSAITLNFDIGALHMTGEAATTDALLDRVIRLISHVHISEPQLAPAPAAIEPLGTIIGALAQRRYRGWHSIEMRRNGEDALTTLSACLARASSVLVAGSGSGVRDA